MDLISEKKDGSNYEFFAAKIGFTPKKHKKCDFSTTI
jgi:hypothetical protein